MRPDAFFHFGRGTEYSTSVEFLEILSARYNAVPL
jgi:hypothetical protein